MIRKFLQKIYVIQVVDNRKRAKKLGKGYTHAYRLNPYNPLSYLTLTIAIIVYIIMFGVVGGWSETGTKNPFKWH